jgi:hypothetical protein
MKKLVVLLAAIAAVATVAIGTASGSGGPIDQQTGFACNVFDENGNLFTTFQSSDTWWGSGKEQLHCVGQSPTGGNGTVVVFSGFACNLLHSFSTDPRNFDKVSKTGESQLTCYGFAAPPAPPIASTTAGAVG